MPKKDSNKVCDNCGKSFIGFHRQLWCDQCKIIKCRICGKLKTRTPSHILGIKRNHQWFYCSKKCQHKGLFTGKIIKCEYCEKDFYIPICYFNQNLCKT